MFAKMSLLFCCFCIRLFRTNNVCVVPYGVMRNLDAIIRVSNHVRPNPGPQRARPPRSGASDKPTMPTPPAEWEFMQSSQSCKVAEVVTNRFRAWINEILRQLFSQNLDSDSQESVFIVSKLCIIQLWGSMEFMELTTMLLTIHWEKCVTYSAPIVFLFLHMWQNDLSLVSVVDRDIFRWILQVNFAQHEEGRPPSHEVCKKNCCLQPSFSFGRAAQIGQFGILTVGPDPAVRIRKWCILIPREEQA